MYTITLIQLPLHILVKIISKLKLTEIRNLMLTCKTLKYIIINDDIIWKSICRDKLVIRNSLNNSKYLTLSSYNRYRISHNWCHGIYRNKIIIQHATKYMPWLQFCNSQVLIVSVGSELHCYSVDKKGVPNGKDLLWKLDVPKVKRHDIRTNDISRFVIKDHVMICGNRDGCVAIYSLNNIRKKPKLLSHIKDCHENGHTEVTAVELINSKDITCAITASNASTHLRFWYCSPEENNRVSEIIHADQNSLRDIELSDGVGLRCLAVNELKDRITVGLNGNSMPLLIDVTTGKTLLNANATRHNKEAVRDIQWHNVNTISYVTHSGLLQFIDTRSYQMVYSAMDPFQSTLYCVKTDGDRAVVVGSSEYCRCVLFDFRNPFKHVQMYFTTRQSSPIYSLDFDSTKLIAAADRSIAAVNFNIRVAGVPFRDYSHTFEVVNR